jgi:hypothetical protein
MDAKDVITTLGKRGKFFLDHPVHAVLHVAQKNRVYIVHFPEEIYILISEPWKLYAGVSRAGGRGGSDHQ